MTADNSHIIRLSGGEHDKPGEPRTIIFGKIKITKERRIYASMKDDAGDFVDYCDDYFYAFFYHGVAMYASRAIFNDVESSAQASFCRYKPKDNIFTRMRLRLEETVYRAAYLLFGKTNIWIYLNLYRPEQGEAIHHEIIPYNDTLFKEAVRYLVTVEGVKTVKIAVPALAYACGYSNVDISKIVT